MRISSVSKVWRETKIAADWETERAFDGTEQANRQFVPLVIISLCFTFKLDIPPISHFISFLFLVGTFIFVAFHSFTASCRPSLSHSFIYNHAGLTALFLFLSGHLQTHICPFFMLSPSPTLCPLRLSRLFSASESHLLAGWSAVLMHANLL